ncbi:hypothetical protein [Pedobacter sp. L105]|uniref:hypothetical protein n=1 Tax=Pedobacter sp. L105 TaxID=1641871 RepID=UPI00131E5DCE|nr:hypothetical protein [Pedobacter sp. L105]
MAKKDGKFIRGAIGDLVYRVVNEKQSVYPKPDPKKLKQTDNTKRAAEVFARAGLIGRYLRVSLANQINSYADYKMKNRLLATLRQCLKGSPNETTGIFNFKEDSFTSLEGFEFNEDSKLSKLLSNRSTTTLNEGILTVTIPENKIGSELKFPGNTFYCKVLVNVSLCRLEDGYMEKEAESQLITIARDEDLLEQQTFSFNVPDGCLCIVSTFLQYANYAKNNPSVINHKTFNPGQISKALITPGVYQDNDDSSWEKMEAKPKRK